MKVKAEHGEMLDELISIYGEKKLIKELEKSHKFKVKWIKDRQVDSVISRLSVATLIEKQLNK